MEEPINPNEKALNEIEKSLSENESKFKKRFIISLIFAIFFCLLFVCLLFYCLFSNRKVWEELPYPEVYDNVECIANETDINSKFSDNLWNTPPRGDKRWKEQYQDMSNLVGFTKLNYNEDLNSCEVIVLARTKETEELTYIFDGIEQKSNTKKFNISYTGVLKVIIKTASGYKLELEDVDFVWNAGPINRPEKFKATGEKGAIIEMFGWKDEDIEKECQFIGEQGYLGVKVFPHHEQVMSNDSFKDQLNPWYYMYQPVSYRLSGRMGTRAELRKMIKTCRSYGVRVYADAVINHMTYNGFDMQKHRFNETYSHLVGEKYATAGSPFWTPFGTYEKNPYTKRSTNALEYPSVPYGPMDFHCQKAIVDYKDFDNVMFGWLDTLADLNTESVYVRERIAAYLTDLFSLGISGFRLDAAKHIKPKDIAHILSIFKKNIGGKLPVDFFTWLEILSGGEADILFGETGENSFSWGMNKTLKELGYTDEDLFKVKLWWSSYPVNYKIDPGTVDPRRKVIQNDDHDTQYADFRGLNDSGRGCILTNREDCPIERHRQFEIDLFKNPYGVDDNDVDSPIRMILSSFYIPNKSEGLPDGLSDCNKICKNNCDKCKDKSVPKMIGYIKDAKAYEGNEYTRVHRDPEIIKAMQQWMKYINDDNEDKNI